MLAWSGAKLMFGRSAGIFQKKCASFFLIYFWLQMAQNKNFFSWDESENTSVWISCQEKKSEIFSRNMAMHALFLLAGLQMPSSQACQFSQIGDKNLTKVIE
jgi:RecA-family ATPase